MEWLRWLGPPLVFVASLLGTRALAEQLRARGVLDIPGARSSHEVPTPRGGGVILVLALLITWPIIAAVYPAPAETYLVVAFAAGLAVLSAVDDVRRLPALPRLLAHLVAAAVCAHALRSAAGPVFQGLLSPSLDYLCTVVLWAGYISQYNFTDGIDGNAGAKAVFLGVAFFALAVLGDFPAFYGAFGITAAAAAAGFLVWNWQPARVFMGDVGSVPLGFLFGWLLLRAAAEGHGLVALILPLAYVADTIVTYAAKLLRKERFWRPHRDYSYQRAVRAGLAHAEVVQVIAVTNLLLGALAIWASRGGGGVALIAAAVVAFACVAFLRSREVAE